MHIIKHFRTITHHRHLVCKYCFKVGLYWRGLTHDLSKYSPTEFWRGAKYYQGTFSPTQQERRENGYSLAWMHHKGRNRHHFEYWTDINLQTRQYEAVPMPRNYLAEMVMDRIAASKTYRGRAYTDGDAYDYFSRSVEKKLMHPQTQRELEFLLTMLRDEGEEALFSYIRSSVLKGKPFPWEE